MSIPAASIALAPSGVTIWYIPLFNRAPSSALGSTSKVFTCPLSGKPPSRFNALASFSVIKAPPSLCSSLSVLLAINSFGLNLSFIVGVIMYLKLSSSPRPNRLLIYFLSAFQLLVNQIACLLFCCIASLMNPGPRSAFTFSDEYSIPLFSSS